MQNIIKLSNILGQLCFQMMLLKQLIIFSVQMEGGRKLNHSLYGLPYFSLSIETNENADVVRTLQFSYINIFMNGLVVWVLLCFAYRVKGREVQYLELFVTLSWAWAQNQETAKNSGHQHSNNEEWRVIFQVLGTENQSCRWQIRNCLFVQLVIAKLIPPLTPL